MIITKQSIYKLIAIEIILWQLNIIDDWVWDWDHNPSNLKYVELKKIVQLNH